MLRLKGMLALILLVPVFGAFVLSISVASICGKKGGIMRILGMLVSLILAAIFIVIGYLGIGSTGEQSGTIYYMVVAWIYIIVGAAMALFGILTSLVTPKVDVVHSSNERKYVLKGNVCIERSSWDEAISNFTKAIELNAKNTDGYVGRATAFSAKREYDRAIIDYNRVIELSPKYIDVYYRRGMAHIQKGDYDKAMDDFNCMTELSSIDARGFGGRGTCYAHKSEYDRAVIEYTKAIELYPHYSDAYSWRGDAYQKLGNNDKAESDYAKAKELGYNFTQ